MKIAIINFPGSNRERDMSMAFESIVGVKPIEIWHQNTEMPDVDLIVIPGGFSYGDYLRSGAMAAHSPIIKEIYNRARKGIKILGVCNGFQILTEMGLLPGILMRNANLKFICKMINLEINCENLKFSGDYHKGQIINIPVAHHDGNFFADDKTINELENEGRIAFRYCGPLGEITQEFNVNGSRNNIAGIFNNEGSILGMMPHPENAIDDQFGGIDGKGLFRSIAGNLLG